MIKIDSKSYREIKALNQSMVKLFDDNPIKFVEEFKMGKKSFTTPSTAVLLGDLVDFFILECDADDKKFIDKFDEKFSLYEESKGSGQVFILADTLFAITKNYISTDGKITVSFDTRFSEAFRKVKSMKKYNGKSKEDALEDFNDNASDYFKKLMESITKTTVDISLVDKSKKVSSLILNDKFTGPLFKDDINTLKKFVIEWQYKKISCKSEVDMIKIDHVEKKIYLYDLKTSFDNELFTYTYLKNKYYIQAAFYYLAVSSWKKEVGLDEYEVIPMKFIVGDTSSVNRRPIIVETTEEDLEKSLNGFWINSTYYNGLYYLLDEIEWSENNNIWNCSSEVVKNNGKQKLNIKYG